MKKQIKQASIILHLIHQQRPRLILLGLGSAACKTITSYLPLWFTSLLLNTFLIKGADVVLWWIVAALAVAFLLCEGLQYLLEYHLNIAIKELELQLQKNISEKAMLLAYDRLEDKESLDLIEKANAGISQNGGIRQMMLQFGALLECGFTILLSFGLLLYLLLCQGEETTGLLAFLDSFWAGGLLVLFLLGYMLFGKYLSYGFEKAGMTFFNQNAKLTRESLYYCNEVALNQAMAKDVRLFQMQDSVLEEMADRQRRSLKFFSIFNHRIAVLFSQSVFLGNLMNGFFYMFVIIKVYLKAIPLGDFVTYAGTITRLNEAISNFPIIYTDLVMLFTYMMYYHEFLELPDQETNTKNLTLHEDSIISFEDVSYAYPGASKPALQHVTLTLKPRQKTAIVGLNGAGKTTLIKLLCGLYEPTSGQILIDGVPVHATQLSALQKSFGVVFQDYALFAGTIKENIAGKVQGTEAEILDVLRRSGFAERLKRLPEGIHTHLQIQAEGIQLSGGEAQKVAIARALYANRPWIILDEPTAALDPLAEIEIYSHLNELIGKKSAIYISHRMSSCQFCDDILVFDDGRLIQEGTHEELQKQKGLYQRLWNTQAAYFTQPEGDVC